MQLEYQMYLPLNACQEYTSLWQPGHFSGSDETAEAKQQKQNKVWFIIMFLFLIFFISFYAEHHPPNKWFPILISSNEQIKETLSFY